MGKKCQSVLVIIFFNDLIPVQLIRRVPVSVTIDSGDPCLLVNSLFLSR